MKSGGQVVGKIGGKPQVASKAGVTSKALEREMRTYRRLKGQVLKNSQKNISKADANGIKTGIFPLKKTYDVSAFRTYANKFGFQLVRRGNRLVGFKYFIKGKRIAPRKNLLGGPGYQAQVGKKRFLAIYKKVPLPVKKAFNKAAGSKTPVIFLSVRAASRLVGSAGKLAVLMDAAGYKPLSPKQVSKLKQRAMQQQKLELAVAVQKGRSAMFEGDPRAMKRANDALAKFKSRYGDTLVLYNYAKANGGLLVQ